MSKNFLQNIIVFILTAVCIVSLGYFNFYISNYYRGDISIIGNYIKPCYLFLLIGIIVIIQLLYVHKLNKKD